MSTGAHVLVVDDDPQLREALSRALELDGYDVSTASNGAKALDAISSSRPDVMVLDVMMPYVGGLDVCRTLRDRKDRLPILVLTARDEVGDRVAGLDAGADDYLAKPFALQELQARLRALLRRSALVTPPAAARDQDVLGFADLRLNPDTREVWRGDRAIRLTRTEFAILEAFLRHPRQVLTRAALFEQVWGYDFGESSNSIHVYLGYLRRKLEADGESRLLHTVRGVGFVLREEPL